MRESESRGGVVSLGGEEEERCKEFCSKRDKYKFYDLILILLIANDNLNELTRSTSQIGTPIFFNARR